MEGTPHKRIKVIGIGGGGINAVNRIIKSGTANAEFLCIDSDISALNDSLCKNRILLKDITYGCYKNESEKAAQAASFAGAEIMNAIADADTVIIVAGMGETTGTGATFVVADIARRMGIRTICAVSQPFAWEGYKRKKIAEDAIRKLRGIPDITYTLYCNNLIEIIDRNTRLCDSFIYVDEVMMHFTQAIIDILTNGIGGLNIEGVLYTSHSLDMGIGIGRGYGEIRSSRAAEIAISSKLIERPIKIAAYIIAVIRGNAITADEVECVNNIIKEQAGEDKIIFTCIVPDDPLNQEMKVTTIIGT